MNLIKADITRNPALCRRAKALYLRAFPKEERLPWSILLLNARRSGIGLTAFLDGDRFCGFTSSVTADDLHFLLFFAVEDELRGQGYGSAILSAIQEEYPHVVLNVEPLEETAPNLPERQRRFAFYRKNGFFDTGWHVWEVGGMFRVLSTRQELDVPAYKKLFRKLTFGLWNVKLKRAESPCPLKS